MIEIKPLIGKNRRGEQQDSGTDAIFADGRHVGFIARHKGAPLQLIVPGLAESQIAAMHAMANARDLEFDIAREVQVAPTIYGAEDDDE